MATSYDLNRLHETHPHIINSEAPCGIEYFWTGSRWSPEGLQVAYEYDSEIEANKVAAQLRNCNSPIDDYAEVWRL